MENPNTCSGSMSPGKLSWGGLEDDGERCAEKYAITGEEAGNCFKLTANNHDTFIIQAVIVFRTKNSKNKHPFCRR